MKLSLYAEYCCDECNSIIHNHFDCPACKVEYAATDLYGGLIDYQYIGFVLTCEECNAEFKLIDNTGYLPEYEWELEDEGRVRQCR